MLVAIGQTHSVVFLIQTSTIVSVNHRLRLIGSIINFAFILLPKLLWTIFDQARFIHMLKTICLPKKEAIVPEKSPKTIAINTK